MDTFTQKLLLQVDELQRQDREKTLRISELEQEIGKDAARVRALEQMQADLEKAQARVTAADKAQAAAERVAEKERSRRLGAEEEIQDLKARIVSLQEQPSRLARLRDEIGV